MRLTIVGGGGFRVPLVYRALASDAGASRVDELVLHDTSDARLRRIAAVLADLAPGLPHAPRIRVTTDLTEAVTGADFVFSAMRVGGLAGRVCDERSALGVGLLGQETTGAGGVCYGLRTIPVALRLAEVVRRAAPEAYVINFTNPAGMVTEAMSAVLGRRVIGICDSPVGLFKRVARVLGLPRETITFDYAGLNHLGWLHRAVVDGQDVLPDVLSRPDQLMQIEEGRLFGPEWLASLGTVPNEYLWYWYYTSDAVAAITEAGTTRGEYLLDQQERFYRGDGDALGGWERTRLDREETYMAEGRASTDAGERDDEDLDGGGYDRVALALMGAISADEGAELVLNVPNDGTLDAVDDDAIVEVPCTVGADGPRPVAVSQLRPHERGLVSTVKDVERMTIEAATSGSRSAALKALALHPLVDSVTHARQILDREREALPELARVLVNP
ncbi:6-phospho-beta-glucosidase [Mumia sp. zg.B53]|uniref:6-phospho-beta-glucosidase n=1 Tax=unclassified Mumia TaxID=2621872 RepID=UPI001C6E23DE|nr:MULTISPECIES: 6-phospho-beta-glucosidase [unclassified Mumia]MBW9205310.1 6-phospho-beta-glucosidase [Mumia sp. zg.B17]MBW9213302.1 6-phospho-beta-glucosidase [Mumia sp. zg.B53]